MSLVLLIGLPGTVIKTGRKVIKLRRYSWDFSPPKFTLRVLVKMFCYNDKTRNLEWIRESNN